MYAWECGVEGRCIFGKYVCMGCKCKKRPLKEWVQIYFLLFKFSILYFCQTFLTVYSFSISKLTYFILYSQIPWFRSSLPPA